MANSKRRIRLWIDTGFAGEGHEDFIDLPEDWEEMSVNERRKFLDDEAQIFLSNRIDWGADVVGADEE
jgi:hypothetical protein